jgi:hypothetical protein
MGERKRDGMLRIVGRFDGVCDDCEGQIKEYPQSA